MKLLLMLASKALILKSGQIFVLDMDKTMDSFCGVFLVIILINVCVLSDLAQVSPGFREFRHNLLWGFEARTYVRIT